MKSVSTATSPERFENGPSFYELGFFFFFSCGRQGKKAEGIRPVPIQRLPWRGPQRNSKPHSKLENIALDAQVLH
jgi:hypothetical protein